MREGASFLLGILVWFAPSAIASSTVYVSAPGEDEYSSCGGSSPCKTITHAFALE